MNAPYIARQILPKLLRVGHQHGYPAGGIGHWCPGCRIMHVFPLDVANVGTLRAPTYPDKLILTRGMPFTRLVPASRCHYRITAGMIEFHADSTHQLAGRTVPLPDLPGHLREDP